MRCLESSPSARELDFKLFAVTVTYIVDVYTDSLGVSF
jgi:hypothetical protein